MEWVGYVPTFPINSFELVKCNEGLQFCAGGCKFCVSVSGSFIAKSCAGDEDHGLKILGMDQEGCKNVTRSQNEQYTKWINKSVGKLPKYSLVADFTKACRCSTDGCNGDHGDQQIKDYTSKISAMTAAAASNNLVTSINFLRFCVLSSIFVSKL